MAKPTIFITGATGFIGAQVTLFALQANYKVVLSVRRSSQIEPLRQAFSSYPHNVDFVIIPDYTTAGAFDAVLQGVEYIIHVASPLPGGDQDLMTPAVKGTVEVLESALKVASITKVVITASIASLVPLDSYTDGFVVTESIPPQALQFNHSILPSLEPGRQYRASKIASYLATLDFITTKTPHFDVVTLHPVYVFGKNLLQKTADEISGTNKMLFASLLSEDPMFAPYRGVHIDDVAVAHIRALDLPSTPVSSFLLSAKARSWKEVMEFVEQKYPEQKFKTEPKEGELLVVETKRAEAELGFTEWKGMEVQVSDVVEQQIELRGV